MTVATVWSDRVVAAVAFVGVCIVLGVLTEVDLRQKRLPNAIVGPLALAAALGVLAAGFVEQDLTRVGRRPLRSGLRPPVRPPGRKKIGDGASRLRHFTMARNRRTRSSTGLLRVLVWRRGWDLNPRWA